MKGGGRGKGVWGEGGVECVSYHTFPGKITRIDSTSIERD